MLNLKNSLDPEIGPLLDRKRLILERVQSTGGGQIDDDIVTARNLQRERLDDACPGIVFVRDGVPRGQA